jgi:outer membrane biogenesis lipoprotein LolB
MVILNVCNKTIQSMNIRLDKQHLTRATSSQNASDWTAHAHNFHRQHLCPRIKRHALNNSSHYVMSEQKL